MFSKLHLWLVILFILILSNHAHSSPVGLLDEFSSIYHSDLIIEVGVRLDEYGQPKESFYLRTLKGDKNKVSDSLEIFGIEKKKTKKGYDQKRLMFFYNKLNGDQRCMNLIKEGVGPFSDETAYKPFVSMVKTLNHQFKKIRSTKQGIIELDDPLLCASLARNDYFKNRYRGEIANKKFKVGGKSGVFREFSPLIVIQCDLDE